METVAAILHRYPTLDADLVCAYLALVAQRSTRLWAECDIDLTLAGVPDEKIHVRLDVGPCLSVKERASACHKSQGGGAALRILPAFARRRLMRYEHFVQAQPAGARPHRGLLEGLEIAE